MKAFIYMNHLIRDAKNVDSETPEPVITIQIGKRRMYCNEIRIDGPSIIKFGTLKAHGHKVRAWIECLAEDINTVG